MLNQKQFGCLKFLSVNFNRTHNWKIKKQKNFLFAEAKISRQIKRHPGHRTRYGKYGPRSRYAFLRTACQPIRIENFEKPYNNHPYLQLKAKLNSSGRRST
jgi:hypothetical protein